jgi:hypothetical protein
MWQSRPGSVGRKLSGGTPLPPYQWEPMAMWLKVMSQKDAEFT